MIYNNHLSPQLDPLGERFLRAVEIQAERAGLVGAIAFIEANRDDRPDEMALHVQPRRQALLDRRPDL